MSLTVGEDRLLPDPADFQAVVEEYLLLQREEVVRLWSDGKPGSVDLSHWTEPMVEALFPYYAAMWLHGWESATISGEKVFDGGVCRKTFTQSRINKGANRERASLHRIASVAGRHGGARGSDGWHDAAAHREEHAFASGHGTHDDLLGRAERTKVPITQYWEMPPIDPINLDPFDVFNPKVVESIRAAVFDFCESTNATSTMRLDVALEELRAQLGQGLSQGETVSQLAARVNAIFDDPQRAFTIATTEASRAMHNGEIEAVKASGEHVKKAWLASGDACDVCLSLAEGGAIELDEPFTVRGTGPYSVIMHPPAHPHCVLGETPVRLASLVAAMRVKYDGPIVRLDFGDGCPIAVTPNHMLLTPTGFARAADLVEGDDVLRASMAPLNPLGPSRNRPNDDWHPSLAKDVFDACAVSGSVSALAVPVSAEYLHGDAAFGKSNIDVVWPDGLLGGDSDANVCEPADQLGFVPGGNDSTGFIGGRDLAAMLERLARASDGSMGIGRELLALLRSIPRVAEKLGFCATPDCLAKLAQAADNHRATNAKRIRHAQDAFPGLVTTTKLVKVDFTTLGHNGDLYVYDFTTRESTYIVGNGIVSSNCMCSQTMELA